MRWIIRGVIILIGLFILGVLGLAAAVMLLQHQGILNKVTRSLFDVNITYQKDVWQWHGGSPTLTITDLNVRGVGQKKTALHVDRIHAQFNLKRSVLSLKPATDFIHIRGVQIYVLPSKNGLYQLAGISPSTTSQKSAAMWGHLWAWLAPQWSLSIEQAHLFMLTDQNTVMQANMVFSWQHQGPEKYHLVFDVNSQDAHVMSAHIDATFKGNLLFPRLFASQFYAQAQGQDVGYFLTAFRLFGMEWKQGQGKVQVWGKWRYGHFSRVHGLLNLHHVYVENNARHFGLNVPQLQQNILWTSTSFSTWRVLASHYRIDAKGKMVMDKSQDIMLARDNNHWQVYLGTMPLHIAMQIAQLLPDLSLTTKLWIIGLQPRAQLSHLYADLTVQDQHITHYVFDGKLSNLTTQPWAGYPSTSGLSALWHVTSTWGQATLTGKKVKIGANQWLTLPLPDMQTHVALLWQKQAGQQWKVTLQQAQASSKWLNVSSQGTFRFSPNAWQRGQLSLHSKLVAIHFDQAKRYYLPLSHLSAHARAFMEQALYRVPKMTVDINVNGQLNQFPYQYGGGQATISFTIPKIDTHPYPGWPLFQHVAVKGQYHNAHLTLTATKGSAMGVHMGTIHASMTPKTPSKPAVLTIKGDFHTDARAGETLIDNSPLKDRLKQITSLLTFHGPVTQTIDLTIPFEPGHHERYRGTTTFKNSTVTLIDTPVTLTHFQGQVSFDDFNVQSKNLVAQLWGQPISLSLTSKGRPKHPDSHKLMVQGSVDAYRLQHLLKWPLLRYVEGRTGFTAEYINQGKQAHFSVHANLKGMQLNLPAPFSKASATILPLDLEVGLAQGAELPASFSLGDLVSGRFLLTHQKRLLHFQRGQVVIGLSKTPVLPQQPGLEIRGLIPYVSLKPWVSVIQSMQQHAHARPSKAIHHKMATPFIRRIDLDIGQLDAYGYDFNQTSLNIVPLKANQWQMKLNGQQVNGSITANLTQKPLRISAQLNKLALNHVGTHSKALPSKKTMNTHITGKQLAKVPALTINIKQLTWNQRNFGQVDWQSRPINHGIYVDRFHIHNPSFVAQLQGHVVSQKRSDYVAIKGDITGADWGEALDTLGYKKLMNKGKGTLRVDLDWHGGVMDIDKATLNGDVDMDLSDGAILAVNPGLIKFLGITDIGSLFQRLQLSGSDVGSKGLAFTSLKGNYEIRNGVAKTDKISLSGPSLDLLMKGSVNLATKTLDQTVVVIPHVSGGVALAAGLLGGPVVAAAAWVGEQIIANTVLKDVGVVYRVTGTWDHPKITNEGSNFGQQQ